MNFRKNKGLYEKKRDHRILLGSIETTSYKYVQSDKRKD